MGTMKILCYYCKLPQGFEPYVDDTGVGWLSCCGRPDCEDRADRDAFRQRQAMAAHDKREP